MISACRVKAKVNAGQISPLELRKANVQGSTAQTDHTRALGQLEASRFRLASLWGDIDPGFGRVVGQFDEVVSLPPVAELRKRMAANPDVARWTAELGRREAVHGFQRARRIPGLTLTLGLRAEALRGSTGRGYGAGLEGLSFSRTESKPDRDWDTSIVFEASMPLPFFDRNQGNIREAQYLVEKTADERRAVEVSVASALAQWHHLVTAAEAEAEALEQEAIPEATETFQLTQEGFRQGKFAYLDVAHPFRSPCSVVGRTPGVPRGCGRGGAADRGGAGRGQRHARTGCRGQMTCGGRWSQHDRRVRQ